MAFNAKLGASSTGNFKVKFDTPTQDLTLKNDIASGSRLDSLQDVNASASSANGSILVYDRATDTYVQRELFSFNDGDGTFKLNGGEF